MLPPAAPPVAATPEAPPPPMPPPEPPPEAPPPPEKPKLPAYVLWGAGGASLLVGTIFGIAAVTGESDYKDHPTYDKADSVHSRALVSDVGLGLGAILIATGTVFYFVSDSPSTSEARVHRATYPLARLELAPVVGLKTQGAAVTLKF